MIRRVVSVLAPFVLAMSLAPPAHANYQRAWSHEAGKDLSAVTVGSDGSSVTVGRWDAPGSAFGVLVVKWGPGGRKLWARQWRPSNNASAFAAANDVALGPRGRIYVVGWAHPKACGEGVVWFLRAYSPGGRSLWMRSERHWRRCPRSASATGVAVGGDTVAVSGLYQGCCDDPLHEGWVMAFGLRGRHRWTNGFEPGFAQDTYDLAQSVAVGALGSVYAVGSVDARPDDGLGPAPDREVMIQKIAPGGSTLWTRILQQAGDRDSDEAQAVAVRGDALIVAARLDGFGIGAAFGERGHTWLARYDVGGTLVWSKEWGERQRRAEIPSDVRIGADDTIFVTGTRYVRAKHGSDYVVRTFAPGGRAVDVLRHHGAARWILGNGGAPWRDTLTVVSGSTNGKYPSPRQGKIERYA